MAEIHRKHTKTTKNYSLVETVLFVFSKPVPSENKCSECRPKNNSLKINAAMDTNYQNNKKYCCFSHMIKKISWTVQMIWKKMQKKNKNAANAGKTLEVNVVLHFFRA